MVENSSQRIVWPRRNLGAAEGWGRDVERHVQNLATDIARGEAAEGNRNRQNAATADRLADQLTALSLQQDQLRAVVEALPETRSSNSTSTSLTVTSTGWVTKESTSVEVPEGKRIANIFAVGGTSVGDRNSGGAAVAYTRLAIAGSYFPSSNGAPAAKDAAASIVFNSAAVAGSITLAVTPGDLVTVDVQMQASVGTAFTPNTIGNYASVSIIVVFS